LSTAASQVLAARDTRTVAVIKNVDAAITVYIGEDDGVGAADGFELLAGESAPFPTTAAIWAEAASGTPNVSFMDFFESTP
jgi:hypothetical protein